MPYPGKEILQRLPVTSIDRGPQIPNPPFPDVLSPITDKI
jgi:hypothetical protein